MNKELTESTRPEISIIIPVYNAEPYLRECLDSIINQTFKNFEVLCINDGSRDNSLDILSEYADKDNRIKLFSQENSGPAQARNVGLAKAKGEYIMFCDADDSYEPAMCEEMYKTITEQDVDIAMCNTNGYDPHYGSYYFRNPIGKYNVETKQKCETNVFLWNKIFKNKLINQYNIKFPAGYKSDDNYFVYAYMSIVKTIYYLDKKLINHYERENSIMDLYRKNIVYKDISDKVHIVNYLYEFLLTNNILQDNLDFFKQRLYMELISVWYYVPDIWKEQFFEEWNLLINKLNFPRYHSENIKNKIFIQIKTKDYNAASNNLDIISNRMNNSRKKFSKQNDLYPKFNQNNIPVIFNCDNYYVKYLSITIQSIIDNSSKENNYDLIILNQNISDNTKEILTHMIKNLDNFSIRFYNMEKLTKEYEISSWFVTNYLNHTAYYRIFIPLIFSNFNKVIYLDSDLILNTDIANLYNQDLCNYTVGAVKDFGISNIEENDEIYHSFNGLYKYLTDTLNIKNINNYFNSGVLLIDIKSLISKNYFEKFIKIGKINNRFFHDQNILNSVLQNDVKFLNPEWNIQLNGGEGYIFETLNNENSKIFHFCSCCKPWNKDGNKTLPEIYWWQFAQKTPFYEDIIRTNNSQKIEKYKNEMYWHKSDLRGMIKEIGLKDKNKFNYYRAKILSFLTFGKKQKHYKSKRYQLKQHLKNVKNILKG